MGYSKPPWHFSGSALYQLSLARKYVPAELPLVSLFGWTLGGFYLARYTNSPAGAFDELVALAGLAWDFPASAAWAARVFVNSREARDHGIREIGLPSRLAAFRAAPLPSLQAGRRGQPAAAGAASVTAAAAGGTAPPMTWWDSNCPQQLAQQRQQHRGGGGGGGGSAAGGSAAVLAGGAQGRRESETLALELVNSEPVQRPGSRLLGRSIQGRGLSDPVCTIGMPRLSPGWAPPIRMFLPSFSGGTPEHLGLLKYSLRLEAHIRPVAPLRVTFPAGRPPAERSSLEALEAVLGGRPLVCLAFEQMEMEVAEPEAWQPQRGRDGRPPPVAVGP
eukprot:scaffold12.g8182.t1